MKKVAIVAWENSLKNMGDIILMDSVEYLVRQAGEFETVRLDWYPSLTFTKKVIHKIYNKINIFTDKYLKWNNSFEGKVHYWIRDLWYKIFLDKHYSKYIKNVDAVIVAGGALKYETQDLGFLMEHIIKTANRYNIPIMLNSVGIEHFSKNDIRCNKLINTINTSTVKCVTTRDDYDTLKNGFITDDSIVIDKVADPAYWIPEVYNIKKKIDSDIVGVNLIRENIFGDYNRVDMTNEDLYELYVGIARELERKGYKWKFYTNGMPSDYEFGVKVAERLNLNIEECILPVPKDTKEYVELASGFKAIIGGRMHATITAYALGIPVSAFVWSVKMRYFADDAKIGKFFLEGENITPEKLVMAMEDAIKNDVNEEHRSEYKKTTEKYIRLFCSQI